jgi:hypothetical protein
VTDGGQRPGSGRSGDRRFLVPRGRPCPFTAVSVTARVLGLLVTAAAVLVALLAGALSGRTVADAILPDLAELSAVADSVTPADATDLRTSS